MIDDSQYIVRVIDHKDTAIRGATFVDNDGFANIFINSRISSYQQRKTFEHEIKHIEDNDFYNDKTIETVENLPPTGMGSTEHIYRRGFDLYRLLPSDPFWAKLWDIWALQHEPDVMRIVSLKIDGYSQRQAKEMFEAIFAPWLLFQAEQTPLTPKRKGKKR